MILMKMVVETTTNKHAFAFAFFIFLFRFIQQARFILNKQLDLWFREKKIVYLLKKAFYGLKYIPRALYSRVDDYLISFGFSFLVAFDLSHGWVRG